VKLHKPHCPDCGEPAHGTVERLTDTRNSLANQTRHGRRVQALDRHLVGRATHGPSERGRARSAGQPAACLLPNVNLAYGYRLVAPSGSNRP